MTHRIPQKARSWCSLDLKHPFVGPDDPRLVVAVASVRGSKIYDLLPHIKLMLKEMEPEKNRSFSGYFVKLMFETEEQRALFKLFLVVDILRKG